MKRQIRHRFRSAFLLVEVMLAVAIFAVAVLALAKSVEAMLNAQILKDEDEKVLRFLDSKMMEIEAGAVPLSDSTSEEIKGWLPDMRLKTTRTPLKRKNEKGVELTGLYMVTLDLTWVSNNEKMERSLSFYIYPRQR
jgi:type II secretory pathway pseudopilin PulG